MTDKKRNPPSAATISKMSRAAKAAKAARKAGTDKDKKYTSDDPIKFDDPDFWKDPARAMLDRFEFTGPESVKNFEAVLYDLDLARETDPVYAPGAEKILDDYDSLLKICAFLVGVMAMTDDSVLTDDDARRVLSAINSVKWTVKNARDNRKERLTEINRRKMKRMSVRESAELAIAEDMDPHDVGSFTDPETIETIAEMYRLMRMHRNRSDGQRARTSSNMQVLRRRHKSLINTHHRTLAKFKGTKAANKWRAGYLERQKFNTARMMEAEGRDDTDELDIDDVGMSNADD